MKIKLAAVLLLSLMFIAGFLGVPGVVDYSKADDTEIHHMDDENISQPSQDEYPIEETAGKEAENIQGIKEPTENVEGGPEPDAVASWEDNLTHEEEPLIQNGMEAPEEVRETGKIAYLTFDDGPSRKITPQILDVLDRYDIKATFFVLGKMVDKNPEVMRLTYEGGHSIGNHTYSHDYQVIYANTDSFLEEVYRTEKAVQNAVGDPSYITSLVRLPGGSHAEYKKPTVKVLEDEGFKVYDWNALNGDSEVDKPTGEYLYSRFKETYRKQEQVIILMHDTDEKTETLEALPSIIEHLLLEGYSFRTLEEYRID
ncbi:MAG: polysaccharide deacetylase [Gudongella sp.]|nr:polysaccharide deacetylase [Gudongella sp.]